MNNAHIQEKNDSNSIDSYEPAEDGLYKLQAYELSSESDSDGGVFEKRKKTQEFRHAARGDWKKGKRAILMEDDGYVVDNSDEEVDWATILARKEDNSAYDAYDPVHDDSDGKDSWESEELKTPPNSDDEWNEDEPDDNFPIFSQGGRFGELMLQVGMKFNTKQEFIDAIREYTIQEGRETKFKRNEGYRVRAVCKWKDDEQKIKCPWVAYASKDHEETCWQLKTFKDEHICPRLPKNRAANRRWLAQILVKKLRKYPNMKHNEAMAYFKRRCGLSLNKSSLTRALTDARNVIYGDAAAQYGLVRDYGETLLKSNPGSTVNIGVVPQPDGKVVFERIYICMDGCKRGFKAGCRPLIGLDGAFLKTHFGGQLLSAVGQDANNHIYPIAWAIVDVENKENWKWFLELLLDDLGGYQQNGWCFMSDMQKGLTPAVQELMPGVHHRFCVWHLSRNFNKQWKDLELRGMLWECARETTREGFFKKMKRLRGKNEQAWAYLDKWPKESWIQCKEQVQPQFLGCRKL